MRRELSSELFLGALARFFRGFLADLLGSLGDVGQNGHPVRQYLQETPSNEQRDLLDSVTDLELARPERGQQRSVVGQYAQLAVRPETDEERSALTVNIAFEEGAFDADHAERYGH
jgi:hypothetical protein